MTYIYNFEDYLKVKESTQSSLEDITSINLSSYRSEGKEDPFTIDQLKEVFINCPNITSLSAYDLENLHIPDEIQYLKRLEDIYFNVKYSCSISDKIGELRSLQSIHIHTQDEKFELPSTIEKLTNISVLNIRARHFSFPNLDQLKQLNDVSIEIFDFIGNFKELTKVATQLYDVSIMASLKEEDILVLAQMENLRHLNLNLKDIQKVSSLASCDKLSNFYLRGESITEVEKVPSASYRFLINLPSIQKIEFTKSEKISYFEFTGNKKFVFDFDLLKTHFPEVSTIEITSCGNEQITFFSDKLYSLQLEDFPKLHTFIPTFDTSKLRQLKLSKMPKLESLTSLRFSKKIDLYTLSLKEVGVSEIPTFENVKVHDFECLKCDNISVEDQFKLLMNLGPKSFSFPTFLSVQRKYESAVFKFVSALSRVKLSLEDKKRFFDLYIPIFNSSSKKKLKHTKTDILKLSTILYPPLQKEILQNISSIVEKEISLNPLNAEMKLAILGNTGTKKTEFKQRLTDLGLTYQAKIQEDTTHIIIGKSIKDFEVSEQLTWVSEQLVTDYLNTQGETPYLLEESEGETNENHENVLQLLLAGGDNALIALEILSAGGVPKELHTALLYVQKTDQEKKAKDKAKKLILANAPVYFQDALADRGRFTLTKSEKDLSKHLMSLSKKAPEIDWIQFTQYYYQRHSKGLRFIFDKTKKGHPIRQALFEGLIQHNSLDLFKALIKRKPAYYDYYAYESYSMKDDDIPSEVFEQTDLIELSLKGFSLGSLPKDIEKLVNLRTLDLSSNLFRSLPKELKALTKLETLIISDNELREFPMIIGELKSLKKVEIKGNRKTYEDAFIKEVPEAIKEQLPNCKFIHD